MSKKLDDRIFANPSERIILGDAERDGKIKALADYLGLKFYEDLETGEIEAVKKEEMGCGE